jgi:hypothetical protein
MELIENLQDQLSLDEVRYVLLHDPALFGSYFFDIEVEPYQAEMINFARSNQRTVLEVPAGHGKSWWISYILPILEICANPNVRIILIMKTEDDARAYAEAIRVALSSNTKLIELFGPFIGEQWSARQFNVAKRQIQDPHFTLEIYGEGGKYLGHRCDLVICDDIVTEENSNTREQRDKLKSKFEMAIQTGPQYKWGYKKFPRRWEESSVSLKLPDGIYWPKDVNYERITVCGTKFHPQDLYYKLETDETYKLLRFDCWKDFDETQPLWPAKWTKEKLDTERRSIGVLSFNKRYRNIAYDDAEMAFQREWILGGFWHDIEYPGCLDTSRSFGDFDKRWYKVLGMDPASGSHSRWATWPSYVMLGCDTDEEIKHFYLIDIFRRQMGFEDIIDCLLDGNPAKNIPGMREMYNYDLAKVESNGYGTWLMSNNRVEAEQRAGLQIRPHHTGRNKIDPDIGVRAMQKIFEDGLVRIPYREPSDRAKAQEFIDQIVMFPKGIYDYVMAFWFAWLGATERFNRARSYRFSNDYPVISLRRKPTLNEEEVDSV